MRDPTQLVFWVTAVAVFGLVTSLWFMVTLIWYIRRNYDAARIRKRLDFSAGKSKDKHVLRLWRGGETATVDLDVKSPRVSWASRLEYIRRTLGWDIPISSMVLGLVGMVSLTFVTVYTLTGNPLVALGCAALAWLGPVWYVRRRMSQHATLFERQLADSLQLATRSLRAGHPLLSAFRLIVDEMGAPISIVFAEIVQQQGLGVSLEDAIRTTAARSASPDLKLFAASTVIQLRSGGNLADMMDRLAEVIRDRIRLHRRARILTSQTQLSKRILLAVPFVIFLTLYLLNPDYLEPLYTTFPGKVMLVISGVLMAAGTWMMNRIAMLRY